MPMISEMPIYWLSIFHQYIHFPVVWCKIYILHFYWSVIKGINDELRNIFGGRLSCKQIWYCIHWIARHFIVLNDIAWRCVLSNSIAFYWYVQCTPCFALYVSECYHIVLRSLREHSHHFWSVPTSPDVSAHASLLRLHLEIYSWTNLSNQNKCDTDPLMQAIWGFA